MAAQVYFVENVETRRIKVGFTDGSVTHRVAALQTGSDAKLRLLGVIPALEGAGTTELQLHRRLRRFHYRGEWFRPEVFTVIRELIERPWP
jgi:Meiotically Up-regulated Gene 113 (MUG113) protein